MKFYYLIAGLIVLWIVLIYLAFFKGKVKSRKGKEHKKIIKMYNILTRFSLINKEVLRIKKRLFDNYNYNENSLRYKSILYFLFSWIISIIGAVFVIIFFRKQYFIIIPLLFLCYYIKNLSIDLLIGDDTKLFKKLIEFTDNLKQNFVSNDPNDVDLAFEESINECNNQICASHAKRIQAAIQDETSFENYMDEGRNEYLRLIALSSSLTKEYGDRKDEHENSFYAKNLKFINEMLYQEHYKRKSLKRWLRGLPILAICPLLIFKFYEDWINSDIPEMNVFYKSSKALIWKVCITIVTILIFLIIRMFSKTEIKKVKTKELCWEKRVLKVKFIRRFIKFITPKVGSKNYYFYKELLSKYQTFYKIEWLFLKKLVIWILSFLTIIALLFTVHKINYTNIKNDNTGIYRQIVIINGQQVETTDLENEIINSFKNKNISKNDINNIASLLQQKGLTESKVISDLANKILDKNSLLKSEYLRWYEIIVAIIIATIICQIPVVKLMIVAKLNNNNMQNDVMMIETIILILMNYESTTPELILNYAAKFSKCFSDLIYSILEKTGDNEALSEIIDEVNYKPLKNLFKTLLKAENIDVKDAFSSLESNRSQYTRDREEENKKIIHNRVSIAQGIALIPLLLVSLYISIPFLTVGNHQLDSYSKEITEEMK